MVILFVKMGKICEDAHQTNKQQTQNTRSSISKVNLKELLQGVDC
jgi:hypothetical protein